MSELSTFGIPHDELGMQQKEASESMRPAECWWFCEGCGQEVNTVVTNGMPLQCGECGQMMERDSQIIWLAKLPVPLRHAAIRHFQRINTKFAALEAECAGLRETVAFERARADVAEDRELFLETVADQAIDLLSFKDSELLAELLEGDCDGSEELAAYLRKRQSAGAQKEKTNEN
jgi:hypothetical protein